MTRADLDTALAAARDHLLAWRTAAGHWEGRLASSALSTATAAWALYVAERDRGPGPFSALVQPALDWLARHQRDDGGWGDTVLSRSNLSTTLLAWAALAASDGRDAHCRAARRAETYIADAAGDLAPERIADALLARYGQDRTFSAPILMMCAQAGRLGPERAAWRHVSALPFELAALPPGWWKRLRLGVVSYALPALVAIGQARYRQAPPASPLRRLLRRAAVGPTLRRLEAIQPASGGFLEAVPLTSFVTMALPAAGQPLHPVLGRCVAFLARSVRDDGAWPIDTNLATWVTTLAVGALADLLSADDRRRLADWLLDQQHRRVHPYTQAAPGGWAWTPLPGGVPDADDTAGALLALARLVPDERAGKRGGSSRGKRGGSPHPPRGKTPAASGPGAPESAGAPGAAGTGNGYDAPGDPESAGAPGAAGTGTRRPHPSETRRASACVGDAAAEGVRWLLDLQNRDGGIPTFCRGWGRLPFDRSSPDLTAHALSAWSAWRARLPPALRDRTDAAARRAHAYLARAQRPDGAWVPLWFGNEHAPDEANPTYGTARVVAALAQVAGAHRAAGLPTRRADATAEDAARGGAGAPPRGIEPPQAAGSAGLEAMAARGVGWLLSAQGADGGWGGDAGLPPSVEETALATEALARWGNGASRAAGLPTSPRRRPARRGDATTQDSARGGPGAPPRDLQALTESARTAARRGAAYLLDATRGGTAFEPAPIGFYFARLWYFERLYPVIFTVGALGRVRAMEAEPR